MINIKKITVRFLIFICMFMGIISILVVYDIYLHEKYSEEEDLNYRGYRGRVVGKKESNEIRIGIFGGSIAMGYRLHYSESIASFLQTLIDSKNFNKKYTVINLAARHEASCTYLMSTYFTFSYLDIDVLVFYFYNNPKEDPTEESEFIQEGYSERTGNWILRNFNYYFTFPTMLKEKYYLLRYHNIARGYEKDRFFKKIDFLLSHLRTAAFEKENDKKNLYDFVTELTSQDKIFIFALAPVEINKNPNYWQNLKIYFKKHFSNNPQVITADLKGAFTKRNFLMYFVDGFHYSEIGNRAIAETLFHYIPFDALED